MKLLRRINFIFMCLNILNGKELFPVVNEDMSISSKDIQAGYGLLSKEFENLVLTANRFVRLYNFLNKILKYNDEDWVELQDRKRLLCDFADKFKEELN